MTKDFAAGLAVFVLGSVSANAQTPTIDHQPVGCVVADRFPRLEARFASADTVAAARAVFQGANVEQWYSVAMLARSQWLQITGRKRALDDRIRAALLTLMSSQLCPSTGWAASSLTAARRHAGLTGKPRPVV